MVKTSFHRHLQLVRLDILMISATLIYLPHDKALYCHFASFVILIMVRGTISVFFILMLIKPFHVMSWPSCG